MILNFPSFSAIDFKDKDEIASFTRKYDTYSDYSFVNLFTWNTNDRAGISWLNGNLVIKLPDYLIKDKYIYLLIGDRNIDETVAILIKEFGRLDLIPKFIIENLSHPEIYAIAEDRDSFDYVYRVEDIANLSGKRYKNKRNALNNTLQELNNILELSSTSELSQSVINEIIGVKELWETQTSQSSEMIDSESTALKRLFENFEEFELQVTLCRLDGKLNGFTIYEVVNDTYAICHFEKSINTEFEGLGVVLANKAAKSLLGKTEFVNWEQDLGIPGLRKSKRSYNPSHFQRKYWVSTGSSRSTN